MNEQNLFYKSAVILCRTLLVVALCAAVWSVFRDSPKLYEAAPVSDEQIARSSSGRTTRLRVSLRDVANARTKNVSVQLYPLDVAAAQREYIFERRAGISFDDFLRGRLHRQTIITGRFNEQGRALVSAPPGKWWIHLTLANADETLSWRVPVQIAEQEQTVELSPDNIYARTKRF